MGFNMRIKSVGLLSFLLSLIVFFHMGYAFSFPIPTHPDGYVNDYAHMLSPEAQENLTRQLSAFEQKTSNQLVIVTIPNLNNQPIEDYSIHLADRWKIGTHQNNNGIILLLSKQEHKIRIEVGYGLEGALPDAIAEQIIQNEISPAMRQGNFDLGIERGVSAIILATQNEYHVRSNQSHSTENNSSPLAILFFIIIATWILLRILGVFRAGILYCLGKSSHIHTPFWDAVAYSSSGGGSSSSGGFSGGGGGFGGGGASGSW